MHRSAALGLSRRGASERSLLGALAGRAPCPRLLSLMYPSRTRGLAAAAGDPSYKERTWVLITESPEGGWGIAGHANTNADIVATARRMSRSSVIAQFVRPPAASRISGESKSASAAVCSARVALPANSCR